jgi:hypothetical protein
MQVAAANPPTSVPKSSLLGAAGNANRQAPQNPALVAWILGGFAILSIGFIFMGYGVYKFRK